MEQAGVRVRLLYCLIVTLGISTPCVSQITISGNPISLCSSPAGTGNYSVSPIPNATYIWTVPTGIIITSGQGTNSIITSWSLISIHMGIIGELCVTIDSSGSISNSCIAIDLNTYVPVMPNSISGPIKICQGDTIVFSVASVARASSYNWITSAGVNVINGLGTRTLTVAVDSLFNGGIISVSAQNSCGVSANRTKALSLNNLTAPSFVYGSSSGVCNSSGVLYSCSPVIGASSYDWNVTGPGASIIGSNNTASILLNYDSTFTVGIVSVSAINGCGNGPSRALAIKASPPTPGPISGVSSACSNSTQLYSVLPVYSATSYLWSIPLGATIIGQVSNQVNILFDSIPLFSQTVSVGAINSCGISSIRYKSGITVFSCPHLGIHEYFLDAFSLFPNPANSELTIKFNTYFKNQFTVEIFDGSGRNVYYSNINQNQNSTFNINVEKFSIGIYTLLIRSENNMLQKRFVIQ